MSFTRKTLWIVCGRNSGGMGRNACCMCAPGPKNLWGGNKLKHKKVTLWHILVDWVKVLWLALQLTNLKYFQPLSIIRFLCFQAMLKICTHYIE